MSDASGVQVEMNWFAAHLVYTSRWFNRWKLPWIGRRLMGMLWIFQWNLYAQLNHLRPPSRVMLKANKAAIRWYTLYLLCDHWHRPMFARWYLKRMFKAQPGIQREIILAFLHGPSSDVEPEVDPPPEII